MTKQRVLETSWISYHEDCVHPDASHDQVVGTRRAFYAGALGVLDALRSGFSDSRDMTDGDVSLIRGVWAELEQFEQDLALAAEEEG